MEYLNFIKWKILKFNRREIKSVAKFVSAVKKQQKIHLFRLANVKVLYLKYMLGVLDSGLIARLKRKLMTLLLHTTLLNSNVRSVKLLSLRLLKFKEKKSR